MSMENAILEHAGALKELAAAIREAVKVMAHVQIGAALANAAGALAEVEARDTLLQDKAAELAAATEQRAAAAREAQKKDADLEQAVQTVEGAAAAEKAAIDASTKAAEADRTEIHLNDAADLNAAADLDYAKDVRPVLLAAIKKVGKDTVASMLKTYGVEKADKLAPEQLPAVLAEAQKLAA